ncbi:hypothetical protein [Pseudonocardia sp. GCM10023141]|uniref:hypothetical protein n=1 Tax=Pseudonocardia sp. GCM10023141 TaxID=3252653 RepID=UPI00360B80CE
MTALQHRLAGSTTLAVVATALTAVPALQFDHWQWIVLALACPVAVWGAWPLHRGAGQALLHGRTTIDTLGSLATGAALAWALYGLLLGSDGRTGSIQPVTATTTTAPLTLSVAAGLVALLLAGRLLEERIPPAALRPLQRAAGAYVPIVIAVAVAAFGFRFGTGALAAAAAAAVTVLLVGCPGALLLATPAALRRAGPVSEGARRADRAVLLGRGLLPVDRMQVHAVHPVAGQDADQVLRLAGSVSLGAPQHPVAAALTRAGQDRAGTLPHVAEFDGKPGHGVIGVVAELSGDPAEPKACTVLAHAVVVGRETLLDDFGIALPAELDAVRRAGAAEGLRTIVVAWDGNARAVITLSAVAAPAALATVHELRAAGLTPVLLTDEPAAAEPAAAAVGIPAADVLASTEEAGTEDTGTEPAERAVAISTQRRPGRAVAIVGADAAVIAGHLGPDAVGGPDAPSVVAEIRRSRRAFRRVRATVTAVLLAPALLLLPAAAGLIGPSAAGAATAFGALCVTIGTVRGRAERPTA